MYIFKWINAPFPTHSHIRCNELVAPMLQPNSIMYWFWKGKYGWISPDIMYFRYKISAVHYNFFIFHFSFRYIWPTFSYAFALALALLLFLSLRITFYCMPFTVQSSVSFFVQNIYIYLLQDGPFCRNHEHFVSFNQQLSWL